MKAERIVMPFENRPLPDQRLYARNKRAWLYALSLLLDVTCLAAGYMVATQFRDERFLSAGDLSIILLAIPIFIMVSIAREAQSVEALQERIIAIQRSLGALLASAIIVIGLGFFSDSDDEVSRLGIMITFGVAAILIVMGKYLMDLIVKWALPKGTISTLAISDGMDFQRDPKMDYLDVGQLGFSLDLDKPATIDELSRIVEPYDRVIVGCSAEKRGGWATFLKGHDIGGEIMLERDVLNGAVAVSEYGRHDTIVLSRGPMDLMSRLQKRALDLAVAGTAAIFLAPLFALVALAIKIDSPGPVFFRQTRVGQGNRQFSILKFRSMRTELNDRDGHMSTCRDDDRITRVGRFIRRTSIDELPQIFNVLRGDMSMVGPRPHALGSTAENALFWRVSEHYWLRHALKPGITGLAQIRGFRGATETREDLERRIRADLEYLSDWSLWSDISIMLKTARVLVHKNAF